MLLTVNDTLEPEVLRQLMILYLSRNLLFSTVLEAAYLKTKALHCGV